MNRHLTRLTLGAVCAVLLLSGTSADAQSSETFPGVTLERDEISCRLWSVEIANQQRLFISGDTFMSANTLDEGMWRADIGAKSQRSTEFYRVFSCLRNREGVRRTPNPLRAGAQWTADDAGLTCSCHIMGNPIDQFVAMIEKSLTDTVRTEVKQRLADFTAALAKASERDRQELLVQLGEALSRNPNLIEALAEALRRRPAPPASPSIGQTPAASQGTGK